MCLPMKLAMGHQPVGKCPAKRMGISRPPRIDVGRSFSFPIYILWVASDEKLL